MSEIPKNNPNSKSNKGYKKHSDELYTSLTDNFDQGNFEEVTLRWADIAFSFKQYNLDGIVNPPSWVWPVPK